eukprot:GFUD01031260.1.p1 GENE.GFUD01031260.1~~GFUD01031260.1.p1  ORF type:complete len:452 (+),score=84.05 GFUD01031260.1:91-1446(+)
MTDFKRKSAEREVNSDNAPPNSRLFIVCDKDITEDDFRDAFEEYGTVQKIEIHRDKKGESKGIAYIKFSKTSEAALAIETLNGRCIGNHPRPLKVLIANNRDQGNSRDCKEEERLLRLFVVVPKDQVEADLKEYFNSFGAVQYVNIVKDRETRLSKGFAYIKYYRLIHAAKAFETCDRSYKPVFADPRPSKGEEFINGFSPRGGSDTSRQEGCVLTVVCSPSVNEDQLWRLFDLIPGLDYCEMKRVDPRSNRTVGTAVYTNTRAASYAKKKLHGFEYPPGERLIVKFDSDHNHHYHYAPPAHPVYQQQPPPHSPHSYPQDLKSLADTIAQATSLIKAANLNDNCHYSYDPSYCSIALPAPQPLAPMDSNIAERLFVVCTPSPPPIYAVKDVFGRFGGLIDFYFLNGKRCGYALFSQADSAMEAVSSLNGQEICGARMKVMVAEPSKGNHTD